MENICKKELIRPTNAKKLIITINNCLNTLVFKHISAFDLSDCQNPILFFRENYFIPPHGCIKIEIPLCYTNYDNVFIVNKFLLDYEPCDSCVPLKYYFI